MVPSSYSFSDLLLQLAQEDKVSMSRIDDAVRRILTIKYQLGLFDDPVRGADAPTVIGSSASRQVSLEAARESITLLENENRTLPLSKTAHILVTGPNADSLIPLDNGWSYTWQGGRDSLYPKTVRPFSKPSRTRLAPPTSPMCQALLSTTKSILPKQHSPMQITTESAFAAAPELFLGRWTRPAQPRRVVQPVHRHRFVARPVGSSFDCPLSGVSENLKTSCPIDFVSSE